MQSTSKVGQRKERKGLLFIFDPLACRSPLRTRSRSPYRTRWKIVFCSYIRAFTQDPRCSVLGFVQQLSRRSQPYETHVAARPRNFAAARSENQFWGCTSAQHVTGTRCSGVYFERAVVAQLSILSRAAAPSAAEPKQAFLSTLLVLHA